MPTRSHFDARFTSAALRSLGVRPEPWLVRRFAYTLGATLVLVLAFIRRFTSSGAGRFLLRKRLQKGLRVIAEIKNSLANASIYEGKHGRADWIRTSDLLTPSQAR